MSQLELSTSTAFSAIRSDNLDEEIAIKRFARIASQSSFLFSYHNSQLLPPLTHFNTIFFRVKYLHDTRELMIHTTTQLWRFSVVSLHVISASVPLRAGKNVA
jgi:hypothetical protein